MNCRQQQAALFVRNCLRRNYKKFGGLIKHQAGRALTSINAAKARWYWCLRYEKT